MDRVKLLVAAAACVGAAAWGESFSVSSKAELLDALNGKPRSTITLTADVDMEGEGPIPTSVSTAGDTKYYHSSFSGKFYGNGHKIYNCPKLFEIIDGYSGGTVVQDLTIIAPSDKAAGLSYVKPKGHDDVYQDEGVGVLAGWISGSSQVTLSNVHISNANVEVLEPSNVSGTDVYVMPPAGGLVGCISGDSVSVSVRNCSVEGKVTSRNASSTVAPTQYACGGLIGRVRSCYVLEITNCTANVSVTADNEVGGLIGGVEASVRSAAIVDCTALGEVDGAIAGGFIGYAAGKNNGYVNWLNATPGGTGDPRVVADFDWNTLYFDFLRCRAATKLVKGTSSGGGFVGYACNNQRFRQCYALGAVGGGTYRGGFAGRVNVATINDCYALGDVVDNYRNGASFVASVEGAGDGVASNEIARAYGAGRTYVSALDADTFGSVPFLFSDESTGSLLTNCVGGAYATFTNAANFSAFLAAKDSSGNVVWAMTDGKTMPYFPWSLNDGKFVTYHDDGDGLVTMENTTPGQMTAGAEHFIGGYSLVHYFDSLPYADRENSSVHLADNHRRPRAYIGKTIANAAAFQNITNDLQISAERHTYVLTADVSIKTNSFAAIGDEARPFKGVFVGRGHAIDFKVDDGRDDLALFGCVGDNATIKDLNVTANLAGRTNVAALAANVSGATIENCHVSNLVILASGNAGGLVGRASSSAKLKNCSAQGTITAGGEAVGGLVGRSQSGSSIRDSYADVAIGGTATDVGGLVGRGENTSGTRGAVTRCFAVGSVSGMANVGGFVGCGEWMSVDEAFALGPVTALGECAGGFAGCFTNGVVENAYALGAVTAADQVGGFAGRAGDGTTCRFYQIYSDNALAAGGSHKGALFALGEPFATNAVAACGDHAKMVSAKTFAAFLAEESGGEPVWSQIDGKTEPYFAWSLKDGKFAQYCDGSCQAAIALGASFSLTPNAPVGEAFLQWTDSASYGNTYATTGGGVLSDNHRVHVYRTGTPIETAAELKAIAANGTYVLLDDIDTTGETWTPLCGSSPFTGEMVGRDHAVKIDVSSSGLGAGLFASAKSAHLRGIVVSGSVAAQGTAGALVGSVVTPDPGGAATLIELCTGEADVTCAGDAVGGLIGRVYPGDSARIYRSQASGTVTGAADVGGLVGMMEGGAIGESFAYGRVVGSGEDAGGLVGHAYAGTMTDCYAIGLVTGAANVGAFVGTAAGDVALTRVYCERSPLVGSGAPIQSDVVCGNGDYGRLTSAKLFAAFLANGNWAMEDGDTEPYFPWSLKAGRGKLFVLRYDDQNARIGAGLTKTVTAKVPDGKAVLFWLKNGGSIVEDDRLTTANFKGINHSRLYYTTATAISTLADLRAIDNAQSPYVLTNDLDVTGFEWIPRFADGGAFTGYLEGHGHVLAFRHTAARQDYGTGLFAALGDGAAVSNLVLTGTFHANTYVGALAGKVVSTTTPASIHNVFASNVVVDATSNFAGGLLGAVSGKLDVTDSAAEGAISASDASGEFVGGLVGWIGAGRGVSFSRCRSVGVVSGANKVGGFVGGAGAGAFSQCFAVGTVTATGDYAGGFAAVAGSAGFADSYAVADVAGAANVGAFAGDAPSSVVRCYGYRPNVEDYAAMTNAANWAAFLAEDCWAMTDGKTMPYLKWSTPNGKFTFYSERVTQSAAIGEDFVYDVPLDDDELFVRWLGGYEFGDTLRHTTNLRADNFRYLRYSIGTKVRTQAELEAVSSRPNERPYVLMNDLDVSDGSFKPIGNSVKAKFAGTLMGDGHVVKIDRPLFNYISGATIEDVVLTGAISNRADYLNAALVAHASGTSEIGSAMTNYVNRCIVSNLTLVATGANVGGLIAEAEGCTVVENCRVIAEISGTATTVGGLVGKVGNAGSHFRRNAVYAHVDVALPDGKTDSEVGGFVGDAGGATYEQNYVVGTVAGAGDCVAGFAAWGSGPTIRDSYVYGEVRGPASATFVDTFANEDLDNQVQRVRTYGYNPRTDAARYATMTNAANWTEFLAEDCWAMADGKTMPYLKWSVAVNQFDVYDRAQLFRQPIGETTPYAAHPPAGRAFVEWTSGLSYDRPLAVEVNELADNHRYPTYRTGAAIATAAELAAIDETDGVYVMVNDVDATGSAWVSSFSAASPFGGEFHGRGHVIKFAASTTANDAGLFAVVSNAWIQDVALVGSIVGGDRTGALAGRVLGAAAISNVSSRVKVSGGSHVGGLVGRSEGAATYYRCRALDDVAGVTYVGGFVGSFDGGAIDECYALGQVNGGQGVGGFAGTLESGAVRDAYALGEVFAGEPSGGFAGEIADGATVSRAYCEKGNFTDEDASAGTWTGCVSGEGHPEILTNATAMAAFAAPTWSMADGKTMPHFAWSLDDGAFDFYCNDQVNRRTPGADGEVHEDAPTSVALAEWTDLLPYADKFEPTTTLYAANHRRIHYRTGVALRTMDDLEAVDNRASAYVVLNDVLLADPERVGIGASEPFRGELFGRHFTVTLADRRCGLFASVSNAVIRRLTIDGAVSEAPFAHCVLGASAFVDCKALATICPESDLVGGFADEVAAGSTATFDRCSVYSIFDTSDSNLYELQGDVGGFVGRALGGAFRECFTISSFDSLAKRAGGFAGSADAATFTDCYALGDVVAWHTNGAFIGWATTNTCLTRVYADGKVYRRPSSQWIDAPENRFIGNETAGDVAKKTDCVYRDGDYAKMTNAATFAAFLANGNWSMIDGKTEPYFAWSIESPNRFYLCNCGIRQTWQMGNRSDFAPDSMPSDHAFMYWLGSAPLEDSEAERTFYRADNHRTILCKSGREIKDAADLVAVERGKDYVVVSNVVCDASWNALCSSLMPYWGEFHGRGHTITLFPTNGTIANGGLFAAVDDAKIRDLTVEGLIAGGNKLGAIAGAASHSEFLRCASFAEVRSSGVCVGGFVGVAEDKCAFSECFAISPVIGTGNTVGGFVGEADDSTFADCYSMGDVRGKLAVGAFAGASQWSNFTRVYSDGTSALSSGRRVVTPADCFIGSDIGSALTNCVYRLADRSAMTNAATFAAFTANGNWSMDDGATMPYFAWSLKDGKFVCYEHTGSTNVTRGATLAFAATPFAGQAFSRWYGGFDFDDAYALTAPLPMTNHRHPHYHTGYEIHDAEGLMAMAEDKDYVVVTNVDASAAGGVYLSGAFTYSGEFFGRGNEITLGGAAAKGIFPRLSAAWVRDLKIGGSFAGHAPLADEIVDNPADETLVENVKVDGLALTAEAGPVGGLVGSVWKDAEAVVSNCAVRGEIELQGEAACVGGFVGAVESERARFFRNEATVAIREKSNPASVRVGGFVGSFAAGAIDEAFATGPVTLPHGDALGGFAGEISTNAILRDAYSLGEVFGATNATAVGTFAGAVTGDATIRRVYSDGLAWLASPKRHKPAVTNFFGVGATANLGAWAQREGDDFGKMTNAATFAEFLSACAARPPYQPIWSMADGATEPYFAWSLKDGKFRLTASAVGDIVLPTDGFVAPGETVEIIGADTVENDVGISHAYWLHHAPFADVYAPTGRFAAINHHYVSARYGKAVKTAADLAAIDNTRDVYVITCPIVAPSFTPNAAKDTDAFKGELYGRHHLVSITNSASAYYYQGLFGYAGGSFVRDVTLSGTINGYCYAGGFAGYVNLTDLNSTEFINCETTNLTIAVHGGSGFGGLIGHLSRSSGTTALEPLFVTNCTIRGAICPQAGTAASSYVSDAGGMVGDVSGGYGTFIDSSTDMALLHRGQYQGGFVGRFRNIGTRGSFFTNCTARGEVRGGVYSYIGGFAGCSNEGHSYTNVFVNCAAYGDVSGGRYCGGFMGYACGGYDFAYCSAYGKVTASAEVGGFVGTAGGSNQSPLRFYRCRAVGTVKGSGSHDGGFVGEIGSQSMVCDECYALGDVSGGGYVGGFAGEASSGVPVAFTNCYALGAVKGEDNYKGGFAGNWSACTQAERCYAAGRVSGSASYIGGFMGESYYSYQTVWASNCVWQTYGDGFNDTGKQNLPERIASFAYTGMTNAANWATFLADDAWAMKDGATMPYLKWSAPDGTLSVYVDEHASKVGGGTIAVSATSAQGGESVTLTATPQDDSFFHNWTGFAGAENLPRPSAATVTIPLDNHRTISAHYGVYVDNVDEFKAMTDEVGGIYQLRVDLDLADENWSPLFQNTSGKKFTGILYGANHVIDNLVCTNTPGVYYMPSLLGTLTGAEVHDLTVRGRVEVWRDNVGYAGGLVATSDGTFFTNCVAEVTVVNRSATTPKCGGFIGNADGSRFMDCRATGDVQAKTSSRVGGFCAYTAYSSSSTFIRCTALGDVCGGSEVGGFSGYGGGSVFIGCRADGFVWGTNGRYVGGLIGDSGETSYSKVPVTIVDSFARGDVRGDAGSHIGGLIGANYAVVSNCWCSGSVWGYGGNSQGVCAMIGYNRNLVTNCFFRVKSGNRVAVSGGTWYAAPMDEAEYAKRAAGLPEHVERMAVATPIATVDQLLAITNDLGGFYALVADLDLRKLRNWTPFGTSSKPFYGEFYGGNHSISNFHVLATNASDLAFFGYVKGARIEGLKLYGKVEQVVTDTTSRYTGGLASQITEGALIRECAFVGDVNTTVADSVSSTAYAYTGMLAGFVNADTALFERCATVGFAAINGNGQYLGGFAGYLNGAGRYFDCYAFVSFTNSQDWVGGFTTYASSGSLLSNCWCYGRVHDSAEWWMASSVGGFLGGGGDQLSHCYMNAEAAAPFKAIGGFRSAGYDKAGVGYLTSNEFTVASNFVGYDFDSVWAQGEQAPYLRCLGELTYVEAVSLFGYSLWAAEHGFSEDRAGTTDGIANLFRYAFDKPTGAFDLFTSFTPTAGGATIVTPAWVNTEDVTLRVASTDDVEEWDPSYAGFKYYDLPASGTLNVDDLPHPDDSRFFRLTAE